MGMRRKPPTRPQEERATQARPGRPRQIVAKKKDIEDALERMGLWCNNLRRALQAYDGATDTAILIDAAGDLGIDPRGEVVDCPPPGTAVPQLGSFPGVGHACCGCHHCCCHSTPRWPRW